MVALVLDFRTQTKEHSQTLRPSDDLQFVEIPQLSIEKAKN